MDIDYNWKQKHSTLMELEVDDLAKLSVYYWGDKWYAQILFWGRNEEIDPQFDTAEEAQNACEKIAAQLFQEAASFLLKNHELRQSSKT